MTTNPVRITVDPESVVHTLQHEVLEEVNRAESEIVLDFSAVRRIDPSVVGAMKELVDLADERSVKVVLRAVSVDIYKVLKLLKLAGRFSFLEV
jgi:anti-anti-sigma regulatory factor